MGAALQSIARPRSAVKQSQTPDWVRESIPPLKGDFSQLPNALPRLAMKLEGLEFKVAVLIAFRTYGGMFEDATYGGGAERIKGRPRYAPYPLKELGQDCGSSAAAVQEVIERLADDPEYCGLIKRQKLGRDAWYAINLDVIDELENRTTLVKKPSVREESLAMPPARAALSGGKKGPKLVDPEPDPEPIQETIAAADETSIEVPAECGELRIINEGPVPMEIFRRIDGETWEFRIRAFVDSKGNGVSIPKLEPMYSTKPMGSTIHQLEPMYSFADFASWLTSMWSEVGFGKLLGRWPDEAVAREAFEALGGADLEHYEAYILKNKDRIKSPRILPHLAADVRKNATHWKAPEGSMYCANCESWYMPDTERCACRTKRSKR